MRCEERQLYLKGMQLEKTVEIQASLWYLSADLTLFFFQFSFWSVRCTSSFFFEYTEESIGSFGLYRYMAAYH